MARIHTLVSLLQRMFHLPHMHLDAAERRPALWAALLGGTSLGLIWGASARLWMRLIATQPQFTLQGTVSILLITSLFGACTGLAFAGRRRGWRSWRHYLPRILAVTCFLPFGIAGGAPLMLTILLLTLAATHSALVGLWVLAGFAMLILLVTDINLPASVAALASAIAAALTLWKVFAPRWGGTRNARADRWLEWIGRGLLLLLVAGGIGLVASEVMHSKPGWLGMIYLLAYLALLYPLFLALRVSLEPRRKPSA